MTPNAISAAGGKDPLAQFLGYFGLGLGFAELFAPSQVARLAGLPENRTLLRLFGVREILEGAAVLTQSRQAPGMWSRVAGDFLDLAVFGASFASPRADKKRLAISTASIAGITALDLYCAQKLSRDESDAALRTHSITINRPIHEVYRFWRNFENLPRFMRHLESVETIDGRSHWVAKGPAGTRFEWDSEITEEKTNELIAWRSLEGADVENFGFVEFNEAPGDRGTEVHVTIGYNPPGGIAGVGFAKLFGREPGQQMKGDLHRFKQVMETGEVLESDASLHPGMHPGQPTEPERFEPRRRQIPALHSCK